MSNKTKIVATIGPASNTRPVLEKMILAGMNVARLNFSHGSYEDHSNNISLIRSLSREMKRPVAILLDLQGPKIRTGKLKNGEPVLLKRNEKIRITTKKIAGSAERVSTTYDNLVRDVKKGETLLLDDGLIELRVLSKAKDSISCKIINGGMLKENKGINLPGVKVSAPSLTAKDKKDLNFGIQAGVDYFALSFVRAAEDLTLIKNIMKKQGADIPVIAKIEKPEAVDNLDEILKVANGIMVARGDLGVEMKPEKVPTIQKHIIHQAIKANKPVITATQMLETMSENPVPTRAEASDVANAIYDGTDAVMLSGETASGKYPVKAVAMMSRIAQEAEKSPFIFYNRKHGKDPENMVAHAVAQSAVNILHEVDAKAIAVFSVSGSTAKLVSKHRPSKLTFAFTPSTDIYNRLALVWGVIPLYVPRIKDTKRLIDAAEERLIEKQFIKTDDRIVFITGLALTSGSTNLIKIHKIGVDD
jgi:pyruvate kinase